jgi:uncharacterized protein YkwD
VKNTAGLIFWCVRLQSIAIGLFALGLFFVSESHARETYQQFSQRLLATPPKGSVIKPDLEVAILMATNSFRKSKGLRALKPASEELRNAARVQAMDLLDMGKMGHVASTGHDFAARMRALRPGQMILPVMAENAARQTKKKLSSAENASSLVQQWITSASHRRNMADASFVTIAIGVVQRGDVVYAVQIFSGPDVKTNFMMQSSEP